MKFSKYPISSDIKKNLERLGFNKTTDIQFKSIPSILKGEDVLAIAPTGTGKTAAFAIPVISMIHANKSSSRTFGIKCLIMVPTRELAIQIGEVFNTLARHTKVKTFTLYGGVEQERQIKKLQDGIDILITTPGRMFDLINQECINIQNLNILILDEADHMLALGFIRDIQCVKRLIKKRHQTLFFSATIDEKIKKLAYSQVKSTAIRIQISPDDPVSKNVSHFMMNVEMDNKRFFLEKFIKDKPDDKILIFVRTKVRAERVSKAMERVDISSLTIHGDIDQKQRSQVMDEFKKNKYGILIATDITARGINIPDIKYVINYDLPLKTENYVHRIGRTGRGRNKGIAISFCSTEELELLDAIELYLNKKIETIKVTKKEQSSIINIPQKKPSWQSLIDEQEEHMRKKKKKKTKTTKSKKKKNTPKIK